MSTTDRGRRDPSAAAPVAGPAAAPVSLGRMAPGRLPAGPDPEVPAESPVVPPVVPLVAPPPQPAGGMPGAQRMEFIRAFMENSWARPGSDRPVTRVHVALMVTMGVVVLAVVTGVVLQMLRPIQLAPASAAEPTHTPQAPHYTAVSGWDCGTGADHGFDATGRGADWYTVARGGWTGDGCHGTFEAIPMSGDAQKYNQNQSAVWWFTPGATMVRCDIAVYLPDSGQPADSAATAAQFYVTAGRNGTAFASFVVDETARRGAWQQVGTYPVSQGAIAVELVNQGVPANAKARLAVTQVRVSCTG